MAHPRKLIRAGIQAALVAAATVAAGRVFKNRVIPLRTATLPAIVIYTLSETVDDESINTAPRELERDLSLVVVGLVDAADDVDDVLDDFAEEIETVMHADPRFEADAPGLIIDSILADTAIDIRREGDRLIGQLELTYNLRYDSLAPVAPSALDDFETVEAVHNLGNDVDPGDEASDLFTVEEP